jgi:CrcB protein
VKIAAIAVAGALGALTRYGVGQVIGPARPQGFPWATFVVNITGSFVAGLLIALFASRFAANEVLAAALLVGFLGAYTTFSAFAVQTQQLLGAGASTTAVVYMAASVVFGVAAAWGGVLLGNAAAGS